MHKYLRPERLDANPDSPTAAKEWFHWKRTFTNFLTSAGEEAPDKLSMLVNFVSPRVYEYIGESDNYDAAIALLEAVYVRPKNEVLARHLLITHRQQSGETLDQFLQEVLAKDCNFQQVSADKYKEEYIRDAFINGLSSQIVRQRLLENKTLDLKTMFDQARTLELAQRSNEVYAPPYSVTAATGQKQDDIVSNSATNQQPITEEEKSTLAVAQRTGNKQKCFFCGNNAHARRFCPAKDATCHNCGKKGHFSKCANLVQQTREHLPRVLLY